MIKEFPALQRYETWIQGRTISGLFFERSQAWVRAAEITLQGPDKIRQACEAWSKACDQILISTAKEFDLNAISIFAMGKLGANELNLSSDIDLILVSDDAHDIQLPKVRKWLQALQLSTQQGAFRVDLDLRPGGRYSSILCTTAEFEDYYGNYGEAWERLALIRLRPVFGDSKVIDQIMKFRDRFCYRKYLDLQLIEAFKELRSKIHQQYSARSSADTLDLKLGLGGIRDIELYTHSLQVIHGGKNANLRTRETTTALRVLAHEGILPKHDADTLIQHYWRLRYWENLVQAQEDRQTHLLQRDHFSFLTTQIWTELSQQCAQTAQIVDSLFGSVNINERLLPESQTDQIKWLSDLGFRFEEIEEPWNEMTKKDDDRQRRLIYLFLTQLSQFTQHAAAFLRFRDFLKAIRAKSSFYILLLRHEKLLEVLARVFAFSPYLSQILISRPEILDSFIYRAHEPFSSSDLETVVAHWAEEKQLTELTLGTDFLVNQDVHGIQEALTSLADRIGHQLLQKLNAEFGTHLNLLAMGKWGRRELGFRSDLDFVFVTPSEPTSTDAKVARRWISWISETHTWGKLYQIDHRLHPKESRQTLVTSEENLQDFLRKAPRWMHQAYLSARYLDGKSNSEIEKICRQNALTATELQELNRIRIELYENAKSKWDIKYCEGGLLDIELCLQTLILSADQSDVSELEQNHAYLRRLEQLHQLLLASTETELNPQSEAFAKICSVLQLERSELEAQLHKVILHNLKLMNILDPRRRSF